VASTTLLHSGLDLRIPLSQLIKMRMLFRFWRAAGIDGGGNLVAPFH
jgi:hypothetical protein